MDTWGNNSPWPAATLKFLCRKEDEKCQHLEGPRGRIALHDLVAEASRCLGSPNLQDSRPQRQMQRGG